MITTRTALPCAAMCLMLVAGGCGLNNSEKDQLTSELEAKKLELTEVRADVETAEKYHYIAELELAVAKIELEREIESAKKEIASLRKELADAKRKAIASATELLKAKAAAANAERKSAGLDRANKGLLKSNASLTKSADAEKAENDDLRKRNIGLLARIAKLEKDLAQARAAAAKPAK